MKYFIIELLEDYNDPRNERNYRKNKRLMVWEFNENQFVVVNTSMDYISKKAVKIINTLKVKIK